MDLLSANSRATLSAPQLSPSGKCSTLSPSWLSGRSLNSISRAANFDGSGSGQRVTLGMQDIRELAQAADMRIALWHLGRQPGGRLFSSFISET